MRPRPPPIAWLAAALAAGSALALSGTLPPSAPPAPLLLVLLALVWPFLRPLVPGTHVDSARGGAPPVPALLVAAAAGALATGQWDRERARDCRLGLPDGPVASVTGRFVGAPGQGGAPFRVEAGLPGGCRATVRAYLDRDAPAPAPGAPVRARGTWRRAPRPDPRAAERAGYLVLERVEDAAPSGTARRPGPGAGWELEGRALLLRGRLQARIGRLYGSRAPLVDALVLARKERLDPGLREAFARAGVAHLLAISGFHVGVVAGVLAVLGRVAGLGPRRTPLAAAAGVWLYVLGIGAPDAALRAAVILTLIAAGRLRRRPVLPLGALATAFLLLVTVDPGALLRVGFQLSFAGTAGLLLWTGPLQGRLDGGIRRWSPWRPPRSLLRAVAAGASATLATLPLVAWHFGRASLVGIPATLAAGPLVALAIPGILATLALDPLWPGAASFLAGGVQVYLAATVRGVEAAAALPFASVWTSRPAVVVGLASLLVSVALLRQIWPADARARRIVAAGALAAGLLLAPVLPGVRARGTVEVAVLDVGQGDAIALRSPRGRWILVDAGPRSDRFDAGERIVVPWLRRRGVRRLEALVLTHPDLDHIGGAVAVLSSLEVAGVVDPGRATAKAAHGELLEAARAAGVGWWAAGDRRRLELDGLTLTVLHPPAPGSPAGGAVAAGDTPSNDLSVVLLLEYGAFGALLTGDAPVAVEERILARVDPPLALLKVGHHGSRTSTSRALVEALRPAVAVIPVGWRNRFGHPHPEVTGRLRGAGVRVLRTDIDGTVVVRGRRDGGWSADLPDRPRRRSAFR